MIQHNGMAPIKHLHVTLTFFLLRKTKTYASSGGKYGSFSLEQLKLEKANTDRTKGNDNKDYCALHVWEFGV